MNFFAEQRTDRALGHFVVPASWFQSINPAVLILAGPAVRVAPGRRWRAAGASRARRPR